MKNILKNIADAIFPKPNPRNIGLDVSEVNAIKKAVQESTGFDVACRDARWVNGRQWLGLVMSPETAEADITNAENVFIEVVKQVTGRDVERENIVRYYPESAPKPSRMVTPSSPTW